MRWCLDLLNAVLQRGDSSTEVLALRIAEWALAVAVLTLIAVFAQICLANRQLHLARKELDAVELDLKNSSELIESSRRRAYLFLTIRSIVSGGSQTQVTLQLHNSGNRVIDRARITLLMPTASLNGIMGGSTYQLRGVADDTVSPTYRRFEFDVDQPVYPSDPLTLMPIWFTGIYAEARGKFKWRIVYEDGATPSVSDYMDLNESFCPSDTKGQKH